ncbi:MAG TPA: hypothetical protein VE974_01035 [Thermoanaerobaculia bacterium]|nr:hypothetical protein [Thermoanaerobaculia bacterium]
MKTLFWGLTASLIYGVGGAALLWFLVDLAEATTFLLHYIKSFNVLVSFGLSLATAWIVFRSQRTLPTIISTAFETQELPKNYYIYRNRFLNASRSIAFSGFHIVGAWIIFSWLCQFPLYGMSELLMTFATCAQYGLGVYIGRKLFYAGMMLQSLLGTKVSRNLFRDRKLDDINTYVHLASTLTIIFVYVHVRSYYGGPFVFNSPLGESARLFVILPAIIATPVLLIFNFYPRAVLRKVYGESIDAEVASLRETLNNEALTPYERKSYLIEFDKMSRDELRYSLQLTLSDLPIGFTILIMILDPLLKR